MGTPAPIANAVAAYPSGAEVKSRGCHVDVSRGGLEVIDRIADEWRDLCARTANDQPFYRPEWIRAHIRAFESQPTVVLITVRVDGRPCLLLPLIEGRKIFSGVPVRMLRTPVNAHGGRFDAVKVNNPHADAAIAAAWDTLKHLHGWDVLEFRDIPAGSAVDQLLGEAQEGRHRIVAVPERPNPYVAVPSSPGLLELLPPNSRLRTKLRQSRRELSQRGTLTFSRVTAADRHALDRFYALEASGWKGKEGSAIACSPQTRQFYDEIAESAARFGYFSLYMLELNGQLLAAHFSLTSGNRCYSPKVAFDEKFKRFAPGHLIVAEILKDCVARGISGFDITGPDDEWKMKWTNETRPVNHYYVFQGAMGNLAHTIRFRIRPGIRSRLRGRSA